MIKRNYLLFLFVFLIPLCNCFGQHDSTIIDNISFTSGDIFIQKTANDSFSFFQIGIISSPLDEGIIIFKGLFLLDNVEIEKSRIELMKKEFSNYFDSSDIYYASFEELLKLIDDGTIVKHYPFISSSPTTSNSSFFLSLFFGFFFFSGFVVFNYLIIWSSNLWMGQFYKKGLITQLVLIAFLTIIISMITILGRFPPIDYVKFGYMIIRNIVFAELAFITFLRIDHFTNNRYSFLKSKFTSLILILIAGFLILIFVQTITLLIIDRPSAFSLLGTLEYGLYSGEGFALYFYFSSFCLALFFYKFFKQQKELSLNQKEYEITRLNELKTKAELEALTAKTNPHFLYNSLNTIAALAKIDADKTEKMAVALSKFLKYSTNRQGTNLVSLKEEIEMVETYLSVEKIRFEDQLEYQIAVDKTIENVEMPRFLLQPLVENALKHGYQSASEKIFIKVEATPAKNGVVLKIKDSGLHFTEDFTGGYGLDGVSKKLFLLFPNQHRLELLNEPEKMVRITLW